MSLKLINVLCERPFGALKMLDGKDPFWICFCSTRADMAQGVEGGHPLIASLVDKCPLCVDGVLEQDSVVYTGSVVVSPTLLLMCGPAPSMSPLVCIWNDRQNVKCFGCAMRCC